MSPIIRRFNVSDAILLAHTGKVIERLPEDLAIIQVEIPVIDQEFADQLNADYRLALEEGGDDVARGKVGQKTQTLTRAKQSVPVRSNLMNNFSSYRSSPQNPIPLSQD